MSNKTLISDTDLGIRLDKLDGLTTLDDQLQLVYEWVKTGHINLAQFRRLVTNAVVGDFVAQLERKAQ